MATVLANVISPEILIVAGVVVLLFGGSQLPKLARSIGQAKHEFEKGHHADGKDEPKDGKDAKKSSSDSEPKNPEGPAI
jgi:sec-independent protein translocase protein TatA